MGASQLREQVADALAHNDACGPGPVSRGEYLADADVLIALIAPSMVPCDDAAVERAARTLAERFAPDFDPANRGTHNCYALEVVKAVLRAAGGQDAV